MSDIPLYPGLWLMSCHIYCKHELQTEEKHEHEPPSPNGMYGDFVCCENAEFISQLALTKLTILAANTANTSFENFIIISK